MLWNFVALGLAAVSVTAKDTGNHPEWERWCGKVYEPKYPSFDSGGQVVEPPELADGPGLYVQFQPRYSLYLDSEKEAEFVVSAQVSKWHGVSWPSLESPNDAPPVHFTINLQSNNDVLVSNNITVGTEAKVLNFSLSDLKPQMDPYEVVLYGATEDGKPTVQATSELLYLPEKKEGSVTRLDNLNGGFMFRNSKTDGEFEPLLPYGFYASCDGFLCDDDNVEAVQKYFDLGLNGMIPLTTVFDNPAVYQKFNELDLKFMYDLRSVFQNLTEVKRQVSEIATADAIYGYWGVDEPDGWQYPFDDPVKAHDMIRSIDPYHPVAITLNCQNYYFDKYTVGADLIMEDAYPIGINSTFSKWGTACNTTYGDCGCDNCEGNVQDVANRLDTLNLYEEWLGRWPKTKAHNPQSFHGEGYWARDPTVDEEVAMNALAFNHGAKSIVSWVWPTSDELANIHGEFATVVTQDPVKDFIVTQKAEQVDVEEYDVVDVAFWKKENEMLLSVVNGGYVSINQTVTVTLPDDVKPKSVKSNAWGKASWKLDGSQISVNHMAEMSTYMAILEL